jgi:hypothetical protein
MKRLLLAILGMLLLSVTIIAYGCGEVDPAQAPAGSSITLVGFGDGGESLEYDCDADWDVPTPCLTTFRDYCIATCERHFISATADTSPSISIYSKGQRDAYFNCLADPLTTAQDCAAQVCDGGSVWISTCEDGDISSAARNYIRSDVGQCGYIAYLISAIVQGPGQQVAAEGNTTVTNPLNNVEVRWTVAGGELYLPADVPGDVPALSNPYYDETDERGITEVKYRVPVPYQCGATTTFQIGASVGVATDAANITVTISEGDSSDDDTTE